VRFVDIGRWLDSYFTGFSVAVFHCSFHPTRGNIIDWSMKASEGKYLKWLMSFCKSHSSFHEGLNLDGVEFSTLPSGLHLVDEDVVQVILIFSWSFLSKRYTLQTYNASSPPWYIRLPTATDK
jgi:hypothetical protein